MAGKSDKKAAQSRKNDLKALRKLLATTERAHRQVSLVAAAAQAHAQRLAVVLRDAESALATALAQTADGPAPAATVRRTATARTTTARTRTATAKTTTAARRRTGPAKTAPARTATTTAPRRRA